MDDFVLMLVSSHFLLPGDVLSTAAQEHSLPAYMWRAVTGHRAVQLFIQHIRPAVKLSAHYDI